MLRIYHVPGTRSARIIWLMDELGVPVEIEQISFSREFRMSPEWLAKNPVGKVPVLEHDGNVMFESGAMVQYLLARFGEGRLEPDHADWQYAVYLQWLWFAEATFARPLGEMVNHRREFKPARAEIIAEMRHRVLLCLDAVDDFIRDKSFLTGEFSAADVMMGYSLMLCEQLVPDFPQTQARRYFAELAARPGAARAFSLEGGPLG